MGCFSRQYNTKTFQTKVKSYKPTSLQQIDKTKAPLTSTNRGQSSTKKTGGLLS